MPRLSFIFLVVLLMACQQDQVITQIAQPDIRVQNGRLVFSSELLYADKLTEIEKMGPAEKAAWVGQYKFSPLSKRLMGIAERQAYLEDHKMANLTPAHFVVLNEDRLIQFGEDVVLFDDHTKYYMNAAEYDQLADKSDIMKSMKTAEFMGRPLGVVKEEPVSSAGREFDAWNKGDIGAGGRQFQNFWYNGIQKKFVYEWYAYTEKIYPITTGCSGDIQIKSTLYLRVKLEEYRKKNCCQWAWFECNDPRIISYDLSWEGVYFDYGAHPSWAGCGYRDLSFGPMHGATTRAYDENAKVYYNQQYYLTDTGVFWGEWHATFDLKRWHGSVSGWACQKFWLTNQDDCYNNI
jgi:hypothetical protein